MKLRIRLRGISGDAEGNTWEADTILRAGRLATLEIVLDDFSVSRRHAEIRATEKGWCIRDLGSTNGTFLNGIRLGPGEWAIRPHDVIRFGNVTFVVDSVRNIADEAARPIENMQVAASHSQSWEESFTGQHPLLTVPGSLEGLEEVRTDGTPIKPCTVVNEYLGSHFNDDLFAKSSAPKSPAPNVECAVYAPVHVAQGEDVLIQAFAYISGNGAEATRMAKEFDDTTARRGITTLSLLIRHGERLRFHLCLHGLNLQDATREMTWLGSAASVQFGVKIPTSRPAGNLLGTVLVSAGEIPVGRIDFKLVVVSDHPEREATSVAQAAVRFRKAFVSYASQDRPEVLRRVQMLRPPLTDIEVFQDIFDLEPGDPFEAILHRRIDECDIFLLFWSSNARKSEWVQHEIGRARQRQGLNGELPPTIWPVIIEGPPPPPPPPTLAHLHFNDYMLYFSGSTLNATS